MPDEWKIYRLCKMLKCLPSELENESAATLDWLLAIDETVNISRAKIQNGGA